MQLDYDEARWPELGAFRRACLANDTQRMRDIAARAHAWYENENPTNMPLERLATVFQWQHHASAGDVAAVEALFAASPWGLNEPWTAQGWLPITQATNEPGEGYEMLRLLLRLGADPRKEVGDPDERVDAAGNARYAGNEALASWLEHESSKPEPGATLVIAKTRAVEAPVEVVFNALTSSDAIVSFFPYDAVESDWTVGAEILFRGAVGNAPFTDFGTIEVLDRPKAFQYRYWSDNHGTERTPENHLRIRYDVAPHPEGTTVRVTHFDLRDAGYREMMTGAWDMLLGALANYVGARP